MNSYLLYKTFTAAQEDPALKIPLTHAEFTLQLVKDLLAIDPPPAPKTRGRHPTAPVQHLRLVPTVYRHLPGMLPSTPLHARPRRRCVVCSSINVRKDTRFFCMRCDVPLCIVPCFEIYHKDANVAAARRALDSVEA